MSRPSSYSASFGARLRLVDMAMADPRMYSRLGRELRKKSFRVQLLFCWALGIFWIAGGVMIRSTLAWAVPLGVLFLVAPFAIRVQQRRRSEG